MALLGGGEALDVVPVLDVGLPLAAEALRPFLQGHLADHPVAGLGELHRDVVHAAGDAALTDRHLLVQHLPEDQRLGGALLEAPHVHHARGDHLAGVDVRHARHRHENRPAAEDLDHDTQDPGRQTARAQHRHEVAQLAHLVAGRVEHRQAGQACREDAGRGRAHEQRA